MSDVAVAESLGRCPAGERSPLLRIALCRRAGQVSRVASADVAGQLQEAGRMAVQLDALPPPRDELDVDRAASAGYDVVVAVGDCVEPAQRLADALHIPLVHVPIPVGRGVQHLVERAVAGAPPGGGHSRREDPAIVEGGPRRLRREPDGQ